MKLGDLVSGVGLLGDRQLGLVVEAEPDDHGIPGHWVLFFEDPDTWKWFGDHEQYLYARVEIISESR